MNIGINTKKLDKKSRRARRNLALKLVLESKFKPEIKRYFNEIRKKVVSRFLKDGEVLSGNAFHFLTIDMLKKHYIRVSDEFSNEMRLFLNESKNIEFKQDDDNESQRNIEFMLAVAMSDLARESSSFIDRTNDEDIKKSFENARKESNSNGEIVTDTIIAKKVNDSIRRTFNGRINVIALTETQKSSEKTKKIEASVVSRGGDVGIVSISVGDVDGDPNATKEWSSVLDEVTRHAHAIAHGQVRKINEPFVVMGEQLKYPGDGTLGASASNIINCRCSALYST